MPSEVVIRRAHNDELSAILALWQAAGVTPPSVTDSIEGLTRLIREPAALLLVATIDGRIVGSVIGGWDGWRGNIYRLAVTPECRRKGIARRLVAEISSALFTKGAERLAALVEHEHRWAIDFWESLRDLGYADDPRFREIHRRPPPRQAVVPPTPARRPDRAASIFDPFQSTRQTIARIICCSWQIPFVEQRLCAFEVGRLKALGESVVYLGDSH
jgi:ribosomal protein S18 acetylase RimI-like enzyme